MKAFRKLIGLACLVAAPALFTGCDDGGDDTPAVDISIPEAYQSLTFPSTGGTQSVIIQSGVDLALKPDVDWLTAVSIESTSQRMRKFDVTCQPSQDGLERTATIAVSASGFTGQIAVTQTSGQVLYLVTDASVGAPASASTLTVTVKANAAPTFSAGDNAWISSAAPVDNGDGSYSFVLTLAQNVLSSVRTGAVTITNGNATVTVTISQEAGSGASTVEMADAKTIIASIYTGINIGNTMECPKEKGGEGAWSGAKVNEAYIAGLHDLGFNAVRIPCAWHSYTSGSDYKIDATWMARVKEVVTWCVNYDMYVVLNSHWDTGWLEDNIFSSAVEKSVLAEQKAIWTQIANAFKDFDGHVIFAGCNEPGMNETSSGGKSWKDDATALTRLVEYEQAFIDAVRATGGNNAKRCLVFQGLGTDISSTYDYMTTIPTDVVEDRLIAEVHYYEPYQWALMETDASWGKVFFYWGKDNHKTGSNHNPTWGEESWVTDQFNKMKTKFVDNGIPVIIGEYSARIQTSSTDSEEFDKDLHNKSRAYYNEVIAREAKNRGMATFYWETGSDVNRTNGTAKNAYAIDGIMKGAASGNYPW